MGKPHELNLKDWNHMVHAFHAESDRGAAVLAGGFVEHILGSYLQAVAKVPSAAKELFSATGPLSSFSQRIAVAYAFGFINKQYYDDLTCVRRIRNRFAHHPLETTFTKKEISELAQKLSTLTCVFGAKNPSEQNRNAYLFACAKLAVGAHQKIEERKKSAAKSTQTKSNKGLTDC